MQYTRYLLILTTVLLLNDGMTAAQDAWTSQMMETYVTHPEDPTREDARQALMNVPEGGRAWVQEKMAQIIPPHKRPKGALGLKYYSSIIVEMAQMARTAQSRHWCNGLINDLHLNNPDMLEEATAYHIFHMALQAPEEARPFIAKMAELLGKKCRDPYRAMPMVFQVISHCITHEPPLNLNVLYEEVTDRLVREKGKISWIAFAQVLMEAEKAIGLGDRRPERE